MTRGEREEGRYSWRGRGLQNDTQIDKQIIRKIDGWTDRHMIRQKDGYLDRMKE